MSKLRSPFSLILICSVFTLSGCAHYKNMTTEPKNTIVNLKQNDLVSIEFKDGKVICGVFKEKNISNIIVGIHENDNIEYQKIEIDSISKISKREEKDNKKPNILLNIGFIILFIVMFGYASMASGLGGMGH